MTIKLCEPRKVYPNYIVVGFSIDGPILRYLTPKQYKKYMQLYNTHRIYMKKYNLNVQFLLTSAFEENND